MLVQPRSYDLFDETANPAVQEETTTKQEASNKKSASKNKKKKKVHFNTKVRVFRQHKKRAQVEGSELWYQSEDYRLFQDVFKQDAKKVAQQAKSCPGNRALVTAFHQAQSGHSTQASESKDLKVFLSNARTAGLERMADRSIFRDKSVRRQELWSRVGQIQAKVDVSDEQACSALRIACQQVSQPSVLFARCIASAERR